MNSSSNRPSRGLSACLAVVLMSLAADVAAGAQASLSPAPTEPGASPSGKRGALTLRGLDGQVLRLRLEPGATRFTYTLHIDETANAPVDGARLRVTGLTDESGAHPCAFPPPRSILAPGAGNGPAQGTNAAAHAILQERRR